MNKTPQKLWNLTQRRKHWWRMARKTTMERLPIMLIAAAVGAWGLGWLFPNKPELKEAYAVPQWAAWLMESTWNEKFLIVLAACLLLSVPLVWSSIGRYPREADVEMDKRLRRMMNMSDEVSTKTDI